MNGVVTNAHPGAEAGACDREPIHLLGAIQPFGVLIAAAPDGVVTHASSNVAAFVGRAPAEVIGLHLTDLVCAEALHAIRNRSVALDDPDRLERLFGLPLFLARPDCRHDCALHRSADLLVIEAEPSQLDRQGDIGAALRAMMEQIDRGSLQDLLRHGARNVQVLTGFDRVLVYRFLADGSGVVLAEHARPGLPPLLGLHYPASDIPVQARALYVRVPFRIIADVDAVPAAIVCAADARQPPLDLSLSVLRSVSPTHLTYLRNMGVGASLSVSIIVEGRLWGLFACHHLSPRVPSFDMRTVTELFVQLFSTRGERLERAAASRAADMARAAGDRMLAALAGDPTLADDPDWMMTTIGAMFDHDGLAVSLKGRTGTRGLVPPAVTIDALRRRATAGAARAVMTSERFRDLVPDAALDPDGPAGLLFIPVSADLRDYVMLFRQPRSRQVTWAGDPRKAVTGSPDLPLSPRASFAAWIEEIGDRAEPFDAHEATVAETLRVSLVEVVLRLTDATAIERQRTNLRQEVLIAELNHRVRNILALIESLVRDAGRLHLTVDDYADLLEGRVHALARAHDQITSENWSPVSLRQLLELGTGQFGGADRIVLEGDAVSVDPVAVATLSLLVHELVTNAAKHGALAAGGHVLVHWTYHDERGLRLEWAEQGGPPVAAPPRRGLGSVIIHDSVPHDLGGEARIEYRPTGLVAAFTIPARHISAAETEPAKQAGQATAPEMGKLGFEGAVLLVEDSLLIAVHLENILVQLGAATVSAVATVADAMVEIDRCPPCVAVLDYNLGRETSLPVADRLLSLGIPYVFTTGYGDQLTLPGKHSGAPVLQKPIQGSSLRQALFELPGHGLWQPENS